MIKKIISICVTFVLLITITACSGSAAWSSETPTGILSGNEADKTKGRKGEVEVNRDTNILVAYFSATGSTRAAAEDVAKILGADIYEIVPEDAYTDEDLAYNTDCRANQEQSDPAVRPAISGNVENIEEYDTVLIGYPIWQGEAPKIISTFLESYNFSGKSIIPFCTSHSSGIGSSDTNLHPLADSADWQAGKRFEAGASRESIEEWLDGLSL